MTWEVELTRNAEKQTEKLPQAIRNNVYFLIAELHVKGCFLPHRSYFGKIKGGKDAFHCHLKSGRPTYVACWKVAADKTLKKIEVYYVGTHENAPY
jgi:mRNA-degrading endonuclease RelE of RelBE toxin-antitoxin system